MNVLLVALSTVAVLAAVLGPLLARSLGQSTLEDAMASASLAARSITVRTDLGTESPAEVYDAVLRALAPAREGAAASLWAQPQVWTESTDNMAWGPTRATSVAEGLSRLRVADGGCLGLTLASGRCPKATGELMVSATDAETHRTPLGAEVLLRSGDGYTTALARVVGTYAPDLADVTVPRPGTAAGALDRVSADPIVMTVSQVTDLGYRVDVIGRLGIRDSFRLQDEEPARAAVRSVQSGVLEQARTIAVDDALPQLLDSVDDRIASATTLVRVSEVQALGLGVFAVSVVLRRTALARTSEWAIGRLRGVSRRRWLGSVHLEPAIALLLGLPLGIAAGWAVARWSVATTLRAGTPVELARWPVAATSGAVTLALLLALVVVSVPSLRRPLVSLIGQQEESRRLGVVGAVAQSGVVLLAAAAVYELVQGGVVLQGRGSQLGLLAPGLVALALALVVVRVAVVVVRRVTSRPPRSLAALVVGRQSARTPSMLDPAVVIAVGVALAVFATQVLQLSLLNQVRRADAVVGAATVLDVDVADPAALVAAVGKADPTGRFAMAAQERDGAEDTGVARVVAVDSARFDTVTAWSPAWADVDVASALRPSDVAEITLTGRRVQVRVADVRLTEQPGGPGASFRPHLLLVLDTGSRWERVDLGRLGSAGTVSKAIRCADGCRLVGLQVQSDFTLPYDAAFTVTGIGTDAQPLAASDAWLRDAGRWRSRVGDQISAEPRARATAEATASGLAVHAFDRDGGNTATLLGADAQDPLPAIVAPRTGAEPFAGIPDAASGRGLDGNPQLLTVVGQASTLPRSLDSGVLVDLSAASRLVDPAVYRPTSEVWLAADAPPGIEQRLMDAGLTITGRELRSTTVAALQQQPTTRAAAASVALGLAALLIALLTLVAARVAGVSRRRPDWLSLRDAGLGAQVRRLATTEIAIPSTLGVVLGLLSGVVASQIAAARLPLIDQRSPGPPLDLGVRWTWVAGLGLAAVVLVVLVAAVTARLETRPRTREEP